MLNIFICFTFVCKSCISYFANKCPAPGLFFFVAVRHVFIDHFSSASSFFSLLRPIWHHFTGEGNSTEIRHHLMICLKLKYIQDKRRYVFKSEMHWVITSAVYFPSRDLNSRLTIPVEHILLCSCNSCVVHNVVN